MQVELSDRDIAQLLAALRNWQTDALNEDLVDAFASHFEDHEPLSDTRSTPSASASISPASRW